MAAAKETLALSKRRDAEDLASFLDRMKRALEGKKSSLQFAMERNCSRDLSETVERNELEIDKLKVDIEQLRLSAKQAQLEFDSKYVGVSDEDMERAEKRQAAILKIADETVAMYYDQAYQIYDIDVDASDVHIG